MSLNKTEIMNLGQIKDDVAALAPDDYNEVIDAIIGLLEESKD